jgi:F-type H+-transporting ATPase subunit a
MNEVEETQVHIDQVETSAHAVTPHSEEVVHTGLSSYIHVQEGIPSITAPVLGSVGVLSFATSTVTILLITVLCIGLMGLIAKVKLIPSRVQHLFEMVYEFVFSFISNIVGGDSQARKVVPYVGSLFVYLTIANLLPMIPPFSAFYISIDGEHVPLFRGATTDFNTTFGLALAVVVIMQYVGVKEQGFFKYVSHFVQISQVVKGFRKGFGEGMVAIIGFLVGLIEIVSEFAKTLSLSLRLFGNMFAHEVFTVILLGAFAYGIPVIWMGMGVLVGVVQSIVFIALVSVYYSLVLKKDHSDGH